jgi:hypothetical protein
LKRFWAAIFVVGLGIGCGSAGAQAGVYAMGSGGYLGSVTASTGSLVVSQNSLSAYGGTFGFYDTLVHAGPVRLGADARYVIESSGGSTPYGNQIRSGLVGGRLDLFSHAVPFSPYLQAEIGGASTNYGRYASRSSSFAYQIQVGLDYTILPHMDARVEYGGGQIGSDVNGQREGMQQVGLGIVVRF